MNSIFKLIIAIALCVFGCGNGTDHQLYTTSAKIFLVNETSVVVKSYTPFDYVIQPGETRIHNESYTSEYSERPTVDNYDPFPTSYLFFYGDGTKCEIGLTDIENYEDRKETSPLVFELTFRFTQERLANAEPCN